MPSFGVFNLCPRHNAAFGSVSWSSFTIVVRNTLSPTTTGDEHPRPGISVTHFTFWVLLHLLGRRRSSWDTSSVFGPRNRDQSSVLAASQLTPRIATASVM